MPEIIYKDLGKIDYAKALQYQHELFNIAANKKIQNRHLPENNQLQINNHLLFCEHPHVFTLGKSGNDKNLLINEEHLKSKGVGFFRIDRGGDITYHGPGQITGYPIFDLEQFQLGIKEYVYWLEASIIDLLGNYKIRGERMKDAAGVWLDTEIPHKARKICAIGIRTSRYISMHGFAFNVNTDLKYYQYINPCGLTDAGITSMEKELGHALDMEKIKQELQLCIFKVFGAM